jgi:hypothetical protein
LSGAEVGEQGIDERLERVLLQLARADHIKHSEFRLMRDDDLVDDLAAGPDGPAVALTAAPDLSGSLLGYCL